MKIILATDGSPNAEYAARFLSQIPRPVAMDVTVITTVYLPETSASAVSDTWLPAFKKEQFDTANEHFDHIAAMFSTNEVQLRHKIGQGHVGHSITEEADAVGADLIVVGAKGHSAVNRILLGSISDFVATQADCSVLVVRPTLGDTPENIRVTIAHDGSTDSDVALDQFAQFPWGSSIDGHVLHVVPIMRTFGQELLPNKVSQRDQQREDATRSTRKAAEKANRASPNLQPKVIEGEHVGESIIKFADQHNSNLIVIGEHRRSPLGRLMLGSTSRYVMRHAPCSVWITRTACDDSGQIQG